MQFFWKMGHNLILSYTKRIRNLSGICLEFVWNLSGMCMGPVWVQYRPNSLYSQKTRISLGWEKQNLETSEKTQKLRTLI